MTRFHPRRGITILLIMSLLAITLALSYSIMRSQATTVSIQQNGARVGNARHAALSAIAFGLRKIRQDDWGGVDTTLEGSLGDFESYRVQYTSGDPSLNDQHSDYADDPWRVTITGTGYAVDPANPTMKSEHSIQVVVQVAGGKLSDAPPAWDSIQQFTLTQLESTNIEFNLPMRIEGDVFLSGTLRLGQHYPAEVVWNGRRVLFVVSNHNGLTHQESLRYSQLLNWGYSVGLISDHASPGAFNNAIRWYDVVYISEEASATSLGNKLERANIGIVNEDRQLYNNLGMSSSSALGNRETLQVIDPSHAILSGVGGGNVDVFTRDCPVGVLYGTPAPGLRVLGKYGPYKALSILEPGSELFDGNWSPRKRVQLPFGGSEFNFNRLNANGMSILYESLEWAAENSSRAHFLEDLNLMRLSSLGDYRPFNGKVYLSYASQSDQTLDQLVHRLGLETEDIGATPFIAGTPLSSATFSYQLFKGGKTYQVQDIPSNSLTNTTLEPDQEKNPLGIYWSPTHVAIRDNVSIRGSIFCFEDVDFNGENIEFQSVNLNTFLDDPIRIPAVVSEDLDIHNDTDATVNGMLVVEDKFEFRRGHDSVKFDLEGRVVCGRFKVQERSEWDSMDWAYVYEVYRRSGDTEYFPEWLKRHYFRDPRPRLTIKPNSASINYHWLDPNSPTPIIVPEDNPDGLGLAWEIIRWSDGVTPPTAPVSSRDTAEMLPP